MWHNCLYSIAYLFFLWLGAVVVVGSMPCSLQDLSSLTRDGTQHP